MGKNIRILALILLFAIINTGCTYTKESTGREYNYRSIAEEIKYTKANVTSDISAKVKNGDDKKQDLPLTGFKVCIDAGHGKLTKTVKKKEPIAPGVKIMKAATASGTCGVSTKVSEESLNLTVAMQLKKVLVEKGAKVLMIREKSECNLTNIERTELWNKSDTDLTIRLHGNGINDRKVSGVLIMVPDKKYIKNSEIIEKSYIAGKFVLEGVLNYTKAKSQGIIRSPELTGFNWSKKPVILLEMGFMTNPQEDKLLNSAVYQSKIVLGIIEGLEKYYNNINH